MAHSRPAVEHWLVWTGLVPLPVFLLLHLSSEAWLATAGDVSELIRPQPGGFARATAWLLVWLPLTAHVLLGAWQLLGGRRSTEPARDVTRTARRVSRFSAGLAVLFVAYHARSFPLAALLGEADGRDAGLRLMASLSATTWGVPLHAGGYVIGLAATVAHAALGVHRGLLRVGLLPTEARRRRSAGLCSALGALAFVTGAFAVIRVATGELWH